MISALRRLLGIPSDKWIRLAARQRTSRYWFIRQAIAKARFNLARRGFAARDFGRGTATSFNVSYQVLRAIAGPATLATIVVAILGFFSAHVPLAPGSWRWVGRVYRFISRLGDPNAHIALFSTAAQIAGVFLGLYFTTLGVVASTSYKDVPANLRAVVIEERAGTVYLRVVAFTGAAALICLAANAMGWSPGVLNAGLIAILSALSVLSFTMLGLRAFQFLDPTSIATYLTGRILDAARASTPDGFKWDDSSFQSHQQRLAEGAVDSLAHLGSLAAGTTISAAGVAAVADRALATLLSYTRLKRDIPSDSYWFERTMRHQSWLTASGTSIEMAVISGAGIQPSAEPDRQWLESRLISIVGQAANTLVGRQEFEYAAPMLQRALECLDKLAAQWDLDTAIALNDRLSRLLPGLLASQINPTTFAEDERIAVYRSAVIDALAAGPPAIVAGTGRAAASLSPQAVEALAERRVATNATEPLGHAMPATVAGNMRFFGGALDFERNVEGRPITPPWFVAHHLARVYCISLKESVEQLVSLCEAAYSDFTHETKPSAVADDLLLIVHRGREACNKLEVHGQRLAAAATGLRALQRAFGEQDWVEIDTAKLSEQARRLDAKLLRTLGKIAPRLSTAPHSGRSPDALGFAFTTIGNEAFKALLARDDVLFADLFRPYLIIGLQIYDRTMAELTNRDREVQLLFSLDVLVEIAELSGYGYLYSHTVGGTAWTTVRSMWNGLLSKVSEPKRLVSLMLLADSYRDSQLGVSTPRELLRTNWKQRFLAAMAEAHLASDDLLSSSHGEDEIGSVPVDPLTHAALRNFSIMTNAREVFYVAYLEQRPEGAGAELGRGTIRLKDDLERVCHWREEANRDGTGPFGKRSRRGWFGRLETQPPNSRANGENLEETPAGDSSAPQGDAEDDSAGGDT